MPTISLAICGWIFILFNIAIVNGNGIGEKQLLEKYFRSYDLNAADDNYNGISDSVNTASDPCTILDGHDERERCRRFNQRHQLTTARNNYPQRNIVKKGIFLDGKISYRKCLKDCLISETGDNRGTYTNCLRSCSHVTSHDCDSIQCRIGSDMCDPVCRLRKSFFSRLFTSSCEGDDCSDQEQPRKRRWNDTLVTCIKSNCNDNEDYNRLLCIMNTCNKDRRG